MNQTGTPSINPAIFFDQAYPKLGFFSAIFSAILELIKTVRFTLFAFAASRIFITINVFVRKTWAGWCE